MNTRLLNKNLEALALKIRDTKLRRKIIALLEDPTIEIGGKKYPALPLEVSPAGLSHHHCYTGGYIEHVLAASNMAMAMCDSVEKVYKGNVNRDLVIAGLLLHDIFKTVTYAKNKNGSYRPTILAEYLDHLSLATSELARRGFPLEIIHIVSAHHGEYGPMRPHTVEALICNLADFADSRLNGEVLNAASYLSRRAIGEDLFGLTSREAFEIVQSKAVEGMEGVARTVVEIKQKRKTHKT